MSHCASIDPTQARIWKDDDRLAYHMQQFEQPYRSTVHLARFISRLGVRPGEALDVGCGAGANIYHFSRLLPGFRWTGVDIAGDRFFALGRAKLAAASVDGTLIEGDFYQLTRIFPEQRFDLVLAIQVLSVVAQHEAVLEQLLAMTRGWLVISSLFSDFDVDARVEATDYRRPANCQGPFSYNVYSLARVRQMCELHGCREFVSEDFEIDIDLPRPTGYGLTTYTERLADGRRLQFTGPLFQPWKFVAVRMGSD